MGIFKVAFRPARVDRRGYVVWKDKPPVGSP